MTEGDDDAGTAGNMGEVPEERRMEEGEAEAEERIEAVVAAASPAAVDGDEDVFGLTRRKN